ncbi:ac17 [Choristoneura murinana nucleopolyhedrovirus]|uniref:Ac17 n=1 Tax=Choristoneura murinana nucleopolyhedrovirus TaxID=1987479 RepID=V9XTN1_9ABAC|nr:ac17 [Choristoneura murinana nucleopolyhedrovirus]AHD25620.1 ac17 [Choristoneura murinana nucleopolyhedrovirus]
MEITVTLVPINLRGVEEPTRNEYFKLTPVCADAEFYLTVKCRSPFAKYKVLISVTNFKEKHLQATVCSRYDSVCVINSPGQQQILFDGFAKPDDEGATVPLVIGPLFAARSAGYRVRAAVDAIEQQKTVVKIFINEAYLKSAYSALRGLFFSDNVYDIELVNSVVEFVSVNKAHNGARGANSSKWVPAINYKTGKPLLTLLFIFRFN